MYDSKCDIWSFGCLVFEMLTRQVPFPDVGDLNRYCNDEIPFPGLLIKESGGTFQMAEYAWSMLQASPVGRPNADQAMFLLSYRRPPNTIAQEDPKGSDYLYLQDCINRHFRLPWHYCSTWIEMRATLQTLCSYIEQDAIGQRICQGHYELKNANGQRLYSHNWGQHVSAGMYVYLSMRSEPQRQTSADIRPPNNEKRGLSTRSHPQHASDELDTSSNLVGKPPGAQVQSQSLEPMLHNSPNAIVAQVMNVSDHRALTSCAEADARVVPTDKDVRLGAVRLESRTLLNIRDEMASEADHSIGTKVPADPPQSLSEMLYSQEDHELSAASPSPATPNNIPDMVKEDSTDNIARQAHEVTANTRSDFNMYMPTARMEPSRIIPFGLTKKLKGFAQRLNLVECDDPDHHEDEIHLENEACLQNEEPYDTCSDEESYATCSDEEPHTIITPLTPVWIPESTKPQSSLVEQVDCSKCVQLIPRGREPCSSCKASRLERGEKRLMLVDLYSNVHALPWAECCDWPTARQLIKGCFAEDPWHPMIVRGYFDVIDLKCERRIVDLCAWEDFISPEGFKAIGIEPWVEAWIYDLPPYLTLGQITNPSQTQPKAPAIEQLDRNLFPADSSQSSPDTCIVFTRSYEDVEFLPWDTAKDWICFSNYVQGLQPALQYDLFIAELGCRADADSWQRLLPRMHVYQLIHPDCSAVFGKQVEYCGRHIIWHSAPPEMSFRFTKKSRRPTTRARAAGVDGHCPDDEEKELVGNVDDESDDGSDNGGYTNWRSSLMKREESRSPKDSSFGDVPNHHHCPNHGKGQSSESLHDRLSHTSETDKTPLEPQSTSQSTSRPSQRPVSPQSSEGRATKKSASKREKVVTVRKGISGVWGFSLLRRISDKQI